MENFVRQNQLIEIVVFSIAPLLSLVTARFGLKSWLKFEILSSIMIASILIFCPNTILKHILNGQFEQYHRFLLALLACYMIASILQPLFLLNSNDESIFSGHLWAKLIANTLILVININSYYLQNPHWNYKLLCSSGSFALFSMLISGYYYMITKKPRNSSPFHDFVNHVAKYESFLLIISGIAMLAYPDRFLFELASPAKDSHRMIVRMAAAIIMSLSFESQNVSEFTYLKDKKTFMLARLIVSGFFILFIRSSNKKILNFGYRAVLWS